MSAVIPDRIGLLSLGKPFTRLMDEFLKQLCMLGFSNKIGTAPIVLIHLHVVFLIPQDKLHPITPFPIL